MKKDKPLSHNLIELYLEQERRLEQADENNQWYTEDRTKLPEFKYAEQSKMTQLILEKIKKRIETPISLRLAMIIVIEELFRVKGKERSLLDINKTIDLAKNRYSITRLSQIH